MWGVGQGNGQFYRGGCFKITEVVGCDSYWC